VNSKVDAGQIDGDLQAVSTATTNAILVLFSILSEKYKSNGEMDLIF
jgi:hypothetical protein